MIRRWPLTLRGTGAAALAAGSFVLAHELGAAELVFIGCLLVTLVAACVLVLWTSRRPESVTRTLRPTTVAIGDESEVEVAVRVRTAVPTSAGAWRDRLPAGLSGEAHGELPAIGHWARSDDESTVHVTYSIRGERRGVHEIGPFALRVSDPFGIARRTQSAGATTRVTVVPATEDLLPLASLGGDPGGVAHAATDTLGHGADNLIARPYAPGDSMRRIHWRATAHRDELMVREEEQESAPEATVILDRGSARWSDAARRAPGVDEAFERALSACASIVRRLVLDGYVVEVIDGGGVGLADPIGEAAMHTGMDELLETLATVVADSRDALSSLAPLFTGASNGPIFVVTGAFDTADAAALAPIAHHSALPVLLAARPSPGALGAAASAGWRTLALSADERLAEMWSDAVVRGRLGHDPTGDTDRGVDHALA